MRRSNLRTVRRRDRVYQLHREAGWLLRAERLLADPESDQRAGWERVSRYGDPKRRRSVGRLSGLALEQQYLRGDRSVQRHRVVRQHERKFHR